MKDFTLDKAEETAGLKPEQILELAELIHAGKRVSFWWTMGVNQGYEAVQTAQAIINIALMTGNIGRPGTGANSITGQCNAMGSRAYSNTAVLYAGGDFTNPARRAAVAKALGVDESVLAEKPTATYNQIIEGINEGRIKGLWILCTNPRHSWTNNETFAEAVKKLELFVVQDIYDTIESAEHCTVFFPWCPASRRRAPTSTWSAVSGMRPCLPRGENEYQRLRGHSGSGRGMERQRKAGTPRDCFGHSTTRATSPCYMEGLRIPTASSGPLREAASHQRRMSAGYKEDGSLYSQRKARFQFQSPVKKPSSPQRNSPMFNTGREAGQWQYQSRAKESSFVEDVSAAEAYHLFMNPRTAECRTRGENDWYACILLTDRMALFRVRVSDRVGEQELYAHPLFTECNRLPDACPCGRTQIPWSFYKATWCGLRKSMKRWQEKQMMRWERRPAYVMDKNR